MESIGQTNGGTEQLTVVKGIAASAACRLGIGTMVSNRVPLAVAIPLDKVEAVKAEASRMAHYAKRNRSTALPNPADLSDDYLAACVAEVLARTDRIHSEAEERIGKLRRLLSTGPA